jgi:hypothetical protein
VIESLDIIEASWTKPGSFTIDGKYWTVNMPSIRHGRATAPVRLQPVFALLGQN